MPWLLKRLARAEMPMVAFRMDFSDETQNDQEGDGGLQVKGRGRRRVIQDSQVEQPGDGSHPRPAGKHR